MSYKEKFRVSFRIAFQIKYIFILLISPPVIYLFIILSNHIQYVYIILFILDTFIIGVLLYFFWISSQKPTKKEMRYNFLRKLFFGLLFFFLLLLFTRYTFAFIHEIGHALVAIFRGVPILDFNVNILGGGEVLIPDSTLNLDRTMTSIAGSFSKIIVNVTVIGVISSRKSLPFEIFLSIFFISSYEILHEIYYWAISIINNSDDAGFFLSANPSINPNWLYLVCSYAFIYVLLVLILVFLYKIITKTAVFLNEIFPDLSFDLLEQ